MAKNLIPEIAKMLGVELGEKFKIKGDVGTYEFGLEGLWGDYGTDAEALEAILCGSAEIAKLPWKPQYDKPYWTFRWIANKNRLDVWQNVWFNSVEEVALLKAGWVFRTREEAQDAQPKVEEEFIAKYGLYKERKLQHVAKISCKTPLKKLQSDTKSPLEKFRRN